MLQALHAAGIVVTLPSSSNNQSRKRKRTSDEGDLQDENKPQKREAINDSIDCIVIEWTN